MWAYDNQVSHVPCTCMPCLECDQNQDDSQNVDTNVHVDILMAVFVLA